VNRSVEKQWMLAAYTVRPAAEAVPGVPGRLLSRTDRGPWHCTPAVTAVRGAVPIPSPRGPWHRTSAVAAAASAGRAPTPAT